MARAAVHSAAAGVLRRLQAELDAGSAPATDVRAAKSKVRATATAMARGDAQKVEISGRGKSGRVVHALDVDLDMGRLKVALEAMGDTQEARKCAKDVKAMLRTGRTCEDGRMRYRLEYRHSELGRT